MGNDEDQKIVVEPKKKWLSRKKLIIVIAIIVILIGGSMTVWYFIFNKGSSLQTTEHIVTDADKLATSGDINGAKTAYNNAINKTNDPIPKSILLIGKAAIYYNESNYDQALVLAKQAEALNLSENVAQFMACIYVSRDDRKNAILYYQKAIDLIDKTQPSADGYIKYYQNEIKTLESASN